MAVTSVGDDVFLGAAGTDAHLFGGQVAAQALHAAILTAPEGTVAHSLHAHFLVAGDGLEAVRYAVDRTRDGRTFATRRVVATQATGSVLVLTASFQRPETGVEYQVPAPADAASPEDARTGRYAGELVDSRDVPLRRTSGPGHRRLQWWRVRGVMPDDPVAHQVALAWESDHGPSRAGRTPHGDHPNIERRRSMSLDHAVWFHRPTHVDGWHVTEIRPLSTSGGRALTVGTIHDAAGRHVASLTQELVLRIPEL
jgi:acyl-CoA thioesterase-2